MGWGYPNTIRWKFLIVMIIVAITPLIISAWLEIRSISNLGADIAAQSGKAINEQTRKALEETNRHYSEILEREANTIELVSRLHAMRVTRVLSSELDTSATMVEIPWFEGEATTKSTADDRENVTPSLDHQAMFAPPDARSELIDHQARKLLRLQPFYQTVRHQHGDLFYRQYVALESGLLSSFPNLTNLPKEFDVRKRAWYQLQKERQTLLWSPPHIDVVSGKEMVNVTMPILSPSGEFIGVSGIDIRLSSLLSALHLPARQQYNSRIFLAVVIEAENKPSISIISGSEESPGNNHWQQTSTSRTLILDQKQHLDTILADLLDGRSGFIRTSWQGQDYFCVYNPLRTNQSVLLTFVPAKNLLSPALQSARDALVSTERYVNTLLPFAALLTVIIVLIALIGSQRFVKPIKELVEAVNQVGNGNFDVRVNVKTGDELQQLGEAFNTVIPQLKEHTKVQEELSVARAVQQRLLPSSAPQFVGVEIAGRTLYADQTGGDYYDFLELNHHSTSRLGIVLGDVSGHGLAAALMMATVRALLHGSAHSIASPSAVLKHINENLASDLHAGQFMTLFYLQFDTADRSITWADAGHDPAIIYDPEQNEFSELAGEDIPLGVEPNWDYRHDSVTTLTSRSIVLLGTDGIWETKSPTGEHFGKARLRDTLRNLHALPVDEICDHILQALDDFRGASKQRDDVSIVIFRPQPSGATA